MKLYNIKETPNDPFELLFELDMHYKLCYSCIVIEEGPITQRYSAKELI